MARKLLYPCIAAAPLLVVGDAVGQARLNDGAASAGLSTAQRTTLVRFLQESVEQREVPGGALLLMRNGTVMFRHGFGYADAERGRPFEPNTPCRVASLSKPVVATLVVMLASAKALDLDKTVEAYLPEFRSVRLRSGDVAARPPTVRECLQHTAGFTPDVEPGGRPWVRLRHQGLTLAQVVGREAKQGLSQQPGKTQKYSGIGYDVSGRVAEVVTGQSLEQLLQERICKPLGMEHTSFHPDAATRAALPTRYSRSDGGLRALRRRPTIPNGEYIAVGGGIVSTLDDYAKFLLLHQNEGLCGDKRLAPVDALRDMYRRRPPGAFYGLGFFLRRPTRSGVARSVMHTGSSGTAFWLDFDTKTIGILFTQCSRGPKRRVAAGPTGDEKPSWLKRAKDMCGAITSVPVGR